MWMEEQIGTRINDEPHDGGRRHRRRPDRRRLPVLPGDALRRPDRRCSRKGEAREEVEVLDVAQMLLASVKRPAAKAAVVEEATETGDAEADDTQYPLTVAHDGTVDPRRRRAGRAETPRDRAAGEPVETSPTEPSTAAAAGTTVIEVALPAGVATVAETYAGRDVESILEGDDVDISEFKAALKEELKAEVLAEVKAELEGALNSPSGTSEPVRAEATSSAPAPTTEDTAPEAESQSEATPDEAEASEEASAGADKLDQEAEPEAAVDEPEADDSGSGSTPKCRPSRSPPPSRRTPRRRRMTRRRRTTATTDRSSSAPSDPRRSALLRPAQILYFRAGRAPFVVQVTRT